MQNNIDNDFLSREHLCDALRLRTYLEHEEINAILQDRDFFQPYLREALHQRAVLGLPDDEDPIDQTDFHAIFILSHLGDKTILPDILKCLSYDDDALTILYTDVLTEDMWLPIALIAQDEVENLWDFVIDDTIDIYARETVVSGLIAMTILFSETRSRVVRFIEKMLDHHELFDEQDLGIILCECGDQGLDELKDRAFQFTDAMQNEEDYDIPDDVKDAFAGTDNPWAQERLKNNIYSMNQMWKAQFIEGEKEEQFMFEDDDEFEEDMGYHDLLDEPIKEKIGRNKPCPCGSGKKYKKCCGG